MSTETIFETDTSGAAATEQLAERLGRKLRGGEVIELISDLGGGKTTFVRGLARGRGSADAVSSPSFTLRNEYRAGQLTLYHFDFYRLAEPGIVQRELEEVLADPQAVTVIEWADIVEAVLPAERLTIRIQTTGENTRHLIMTAAEAAHHLLPEST